MQSCKPNCVNSSKILFRCNLDVSPLTLCYRILNLNGLDLDSIIVNSESEVFHLYSLAQMHEYLDANSIKCSGTFEDFATDLFLDFKQNTLSVIIYGVARDSVSTRLINRLEGLI